MKSDFTHFKKEIDRWVKNFNRRLDKIESLMPSFSELEECVDFNYELIKESQSGFQKLREELSALRLVQLLHLKRELGEKNEMVRKRSKISERKLH